MVEDVYESEKKGGKREWWSMSRGDSIFVRVIVTLVFEVE